MNIENEKLELKKTIENHEESNRKLLPRKAYGIITVHIINHKGTILGRGVDALDAMRDALYGASSDDDKKTLLTSVALPRFISTKPCYQA